MNQSPLSFLYLGRIRKRILIACTVITILALTNILPILPPTQAQSSDQGIEQASTVWGSLGVLKVMEGDVSALTGEMRAKLGLHNHIAIVKESPVYAAIHNYINDASARNYFAGAEKEGTISSSINDGQLTLSNRMYKREETYENIEENQRQSRNQFERDGIVDENRGSTTVNLVEAIKPLSTKMDDASFTSYSWDGASGWIDQYPTLSSLKSYNQQFRPSIDGTTKEEIGPNPWLTAIINANPGLRGLIGYRYYFDTNPALNRRGSCGDPTNVVRQFIPYAKFLVINLNQDRAKQPLDFKLTLNRADQTPYTISSSDDPSFRSSETLQIKAKSTLSDDTSLLLPVEFGFKYIAGNDTPKPHPWVNPMFIKSVGKQSFEPLKLTAPFVAGMKSNEREIPISHQLLVGSTITSVTALPAQSINYQQLAMLNMSHMMGIGSCPFLVFYDRRNNYWVDYGTVLVDRKNKSLQGEEIHFIRRDVSKIRIEEREDEVTSIDSISLVYRDASGQEIILKAQDPQLQETDGKYAKLHKGDRIEVDFSASPHGIGEVSVRINGYYVVDESVRH